MRLGLMWSWPILILAEQNPDNLWAIDKARDFRLICLTRQDLKLLGFTSEDEKPPVMLIEQQD
ncbi:hypothetical protein MAH1_28330 [Sessilibacter sp. MAH1]